MKTPADPIIEMVAVYYGWDREAILGRSRLAPIVKARSMVAWLLRQHLQFTWCAIGHCLERDHGTAINAHRKICEWMETDSELKRQGQEFLAALNGDSYEI